MLLLCPLHAGRVTLRRYDMCLGCFEKALQLADDSNVADIWYNMAQVGETCNAIVCNHIVVLAAASAQKEGVSG